MSHRSELIERDIDAYLAQHERKDLLRLLTCGSVDDGKSTLIGRLLHDSKMIYEDQLASIHRDSARMGSAGESLDLALLTDGLKAEREQGITIDVAYRYFSTAKRKFIIADTPGHEQYTRNMVTGASTADLAVILIDASKGITVQTRRHSFLVSLLGIRHVVIAVNKMDLVNWNESHFESIKREYNDFVARLDIPDLHFIPMSALEGDNVVDASERMPWYRGVPFMDYIENVQISADRNLVDMRFPVQWINRPHGSFRGICGTVSSGVLRPGNAVMALPSRKTSRIKRIVTQDGDLDRAYPPLAVTLVLEDEIDVGRGDMLVHPGNIPEVTEEFDAMVVWMGDVALQENHDYVIRFGGAAVVGAVSEIRYCVDVNTLRRRECNELQLNEIGRCRLTMARPVVVDAYQTNRGTGTFVIVDRMNNLTIGAGMILRRRAATEVVEHGARTVSRPSDCSGVAAGARAQRYGRVPLSIVFTSAPGIKILPIARELERLLFGRGWAIGLGTDQGEANPGAVDFGVRHCIHAAQTLNAAGISCVCGVSMSEIEVARAREAVAPFRLAVIAIGGEKPELGLWVSCDGPVSTIAEAITQVL